MSASAGEGIAMEALVRKIDRDYDLNLTEDEIRIIARQAEAAEKLFEKLYRVEIAGVAPIQKADRRPMTERKSHRSRTR